MCVCVCAVSGHSPSQSHASTPSPASQQATPLHSVTMPFTLSPTLISPSQVQTLITQFHSPLSTVPMATPRPSHPSHDLRRPLTVQSVTMASSDNPPVSLISEMNARGQEEVPSAMQHINGGIVLSSGQLQSLIQQIQSQQKQRDGFQIVTLPYAGSQ